MKFLNLGCGNRYHKGGEWINIDFVSRHEDVIAHDLLKGIPFPDNYFDAVYHSHVLEHFSRTDAASFLRECHRVLKPGGIIRIAVPDLEAIIDHYQKWLYLAIEGDTNAKANYDWIMLELYDQCVRNYGGGEMGKYLMQDYVPNEDFVRERLGSFFDIIRESTHNRAQPAHLLTLKSIVKKIVPFSIRQLLVRSIRQLSESMRNKILGERYRQIGEYRLSGEVHQWMYDRFSLSRLLRQSGFVDCKVYNASESRIPGWKDFHLDTEPDGRVYKPDSLFLEAVK